MIRRTTCPAHQLAELLSAPSDGSLLRLLGAGALADDAEASENPI